jgi:outer membrane protein OmpA-like peptidoglycan-associated protein
MLAKSLLPNMRYVRSVAVVALLGLGCVHEVPSRQATDTHPVSQPAVARAELPNLETSDAAADSPRAVVWQDGIEMLSEIPFDPNSAHVPERAADAVTAMAAVLLSRPFVLQLEGRVAPAERAELGARRARALRDALVRLGVDPAQLQVIGLGKAKAPDALDGPRVTWRVLYNPDAPAPRTGGDGGQDARSEAA